MKHPDHQPSHWSVLGSGICALILTLGIARFAYTPMIPVLQSETGMGEALAGWLAGWNYLGYLSGVLIVSRLKDLRIKDRLYRAGLVLAVLTTLMMAMGESPILWGISRYLAGLSSAAGLMLGSGLILNWLIRHDHRSELGVHFSGLGLGIVVGVLVVAGAGLVWSWQGQWLALTLVGAVLFIPAWMGLPTPDRGQPLTPRHLGASPEPSASWLWLLQGAYVCAGFGYVINATFTVLITEQQPLLQGMGDWMWLLVGVAAIPAPILWDRVARRLGYLRTLQVAFGLQIVGIVLPVVSGSLLAAIISAFLFGFTFIGIVSLVLTMVGVRYPAHPAQVMARLTLGYGIAQIVGPVLAGEVAEINGTFDGSLLVVAGLMVLGLVCLQIMTRLTRSPPSRTSTHQGPT
ncbi:YbfB/YjiJ family MFS transporter [Thiocapsa bogorovii]|uniref:YbfB/YjiJ family MFS transporter n=1 Tax=Thiocapsa bogorovii TaxID=521689 RepID=UPI001E4F809E|nr:YbfB/YjiJ family MFS transporter [Thiocapsa bogorovii]UHD17492.1 YbfB/YjiJ family MFS transporter [Thiocapsa bogorovii]